MPGVRNVTVATHHAPAKTPSHQMGLDIKAGVIQNGCEARDAPEIFCLAEIIECFKTGFA